MNQIPTATLLISYTHQDEQERSAFDHLAEDLAQQLGQPVATCSLDYPERTIWHAITGLLQQGMVKIVIIPLFLSPSELQENVIGDAVAFANGRWPHAHFHISPLPSWDEWLHVLNAKLRGFRQEETVVILAGQGSDNAQINSDLAKQAQLLKEDGRYDRVDIAFVKESSPTVGQLIAQYQTLGAKEIIIVPWLLFSGELTANLSAQIELAQQQTDVVVRMTLPLAEQKELITILLSHHQAALADRSLLPVSWKALQWQITADMEAEHKQRPGEAPADEMAFQKVISKIDDMLPPRYQGQTSPETSKLPAKTKLITTADGSVQWEQMFGLGDNQFGDLALAGGQATLEALLVTMGPIKVMLVYADKTRDLDKITRRRIAVKAVLIAFIIGLVFIGLGKVLLDLFHFSTAALSIAGGAILFIVGIGMVLSDGHTEVKADRDPTEMATYPLALPMMATPIGIVILTTVSARYSDDTETLVTVAILLAIVMAINLLVLLTESVILKYISPDIINVAERVLGLLLAALAVQTVLNALQQLGLIVIKTGAH